MIETSSWLLPLILLMIPVVGLSLIILWWVRKKIPIESLRKHHDVVGYVFSIIGVLYSVILGFTVVNVQEHYNKAEETVLTEATMLTDLYRDANYFDPKSRDEIRSNLKKYLHYVINEEWPHSSDRAQRNKIDTVLQNLWKSYEKINLENEKTRIWYEYTISKLDRFMDARFAREFSSGEHLSSIMWAVLIVGALVVICFMFFFGLENFRIQTSMTVFLTGYLFFILYLVYCLDYAFYNPMQITPKEFEEALTILERIDQQS